MEGNPSIAPIDTVRLYSIVFQKGKFWPLKLLQKNIEAQIILRELSTLAEIVENTISIIEGYLRKINAIKYIYEINDSRTQIFLKKYKKSKTRRSFELF